MTTQVGSISTGTLRPQDLIPTFWCALDIIDREAARVLYTSRIDLRGEDDPWWDSEEAGSLLDELIDALNEHAPPYCYFGAHEGDGADFGFWPTVDGALE